MIELKLIDGRSVWYRNISSIRYEANDTVMRITCNYASTEEEASLGYKYSIHRIPVRNIVESIEYRCPFDE